MHAASAATSPTDHTSEPSADSEPKPATDKDPKPHEEVKSEPTADPMLKKAQSDQVFKLAIISIKEHTPKATCVPEPEPEVESD